MREKKTTEEKAMPAEPKEELRLLLPLATYRKIMAYATICDVEISGFADVSYNTERNAFIAGEVYLPEQSCGGASTHMEEDTMHKFNLEMIKKGMVQLPRLWWHSHVHMQAFFSGTDENTSDILQNDSYNISLVVNKRKEMKAMMYYKLITQNQITNTSIVSWEKIDPLPVVIELDYERIPEVLKKEVEKKVTVKHYQEGKIPHIQYDLYTKNDTGKEKEEKKDTGTTDPATQPIANVLFLPKNPQEAEKRIKALDLHKRWDYTRQEWVYDDYKTGKTWVDYWDTLEKYDNGYSGYD